MLKINCLRPSCKLGPQLHFCPFLASVSELRFPTPAYRALALSPLGPMLQSVGIRVVREEWDSGRHTPGRPLLRSLSVGLAVPSRESHSVQPGLALLARHLGNMAHLLT